MPRRRRPVARLWELSWETARIWCAVYRGPGGLEMRVETEDATILKEPFDIRPAAVARVKALRRSLKRRGWQDAAR